MSFLSDYGLFLAQVVTIVIAILVVIGSLAGLRSKDKGKSGSIQIKNLNENIRDMQAAIKEEVLDKLAMKQEHKLEKTKTKAELKEKKKAQKKQSAKEDDDHQASDDSRKKRVYIIDFHGDIKASATTCLREVITAVLSVAEKMDEIVLRLESAGGLVHAYGLAASQLHRIRSKGIPLTICIDKVAASGGYMMACLGDKIISAPFAVVGSIGVMAQLPNFNRLLKKHDIDFELLTAGEYKQTLSMLGENTEKGRKKFMKDLEDTHSLFKSFVSENRPVVNIDKVATGEIWYGTRALDQSLVDELKTSDEYIVDASEASDVYEVKYIEKKSIQDKFGLSMQKAMDNTLLKWWERFFENRFYS